MADAIARRNAQRLVRDLPALITHLSALKTLEEVNFLAEEDL
ncbi:hypothetical protein [Actinocorallia populi]|nr:hypothetical protein [Actinocorallia populi]